MLTALYIIGGIIAFFVVVLSIPVGIEASYEEYMTLTVKWLFIKLHILPVDKKEKKPKKEKAKKPKPEKKKKEQPEKKPTEKKTKKPNPVLDMLKANGYDGMMQILGNLGRYTARFGKAFAKAFRFNNITIHVIVAKGDAAQTAIEYGKTTQKVFPLAGFLCANCVVKSYDVWVEPDYLANFGQGEFFTDFYICIRKIINCAVAYVFRIIFGVGIKFIINFLKNKKNIQNDKNNINSAEEQKGDSAERKAI